MGSCVRHTHVPGLHAGPPGRSPCLAGPRQEGLRPSLTPGTGPASPQRPVVYPRRDEGDYKAGGEGGDEAFFRKTSQLTYYDHGTAPI